MEVDFRRYPTNGLFCHNPFLFVVSFGRSPLTFAHSAVCFAVDASGKWSKRFSSFLHAMICDVGRLCRAAGPRQLSQSSLPNFLASQRYVSKNSNMTSQVRGPKHFSTEIQHLSKLTSSLHFQQTGEGQKLFGWLQVTMFSSRKLDNRAHGQTLSSIWAEVCSTQFSLLFVIPICVVPPKSGRLVLKRSM